jgi:large subunit ribosomal protein L17
MRHRNKEKILNRKSDVRRMLYRNLVASVLIYEKIKTTETKAKVIKPLIDKVIKLAKKGDLTARRELIGILPQKMAVKKCLEVFGARYKDRTSGFTRIIKIGPRAGDGAPIVILELV